MDLIIGRDANTNQLKVVNGTQATLIGAPASVPMDVSRQHCKLEVIDKDTFVITNIKAANVTWVNGVEVHSKQITVADKVQLGASKYVMPLAEIRDKIVPTIVDIRPLKAVWENYNNGLIAIRKRKERNNLLLRVPFVLTLLGGLVATMNEELRVVSSVFTVIAFAVTLYGLYLSITDKSIEKQEELKKQFQSDYVCPKCGKFFGNLDYDLLVREHTCCSKCKARFII